MSKKRAMLIGLDAADPLMVKELIQAGRLPNMQKLLTQGCAHESLAMRGAFPTVTPPNWASLATGNWPRTHGITCYYNHTLGKDLQINEVNWDSRRVESELIWEALSKQGMRSIMLNYVEAWPPRFADQNGIYIDGSGVIPFMRLAVDYQKVVTLKDGDFQYEEHIHTVKETSNDCVIKGDQYKKMLGEKQTDENGFAPVAEYESKVMIPGTNGLKTDDADEIISPLKEPENWGITLPTEAKCAMIILNNGRVRRYAVLTASDGIHYDTVSIYKNRSSEKPLGVAKAHGWSEAIYDTYEYEGEQVKVSYIIRAMNIAEDGSFAEFYISNATNMDDLNYYYPQEVGKEILEKVGPMFPYAKFGRELTHEGAEILLESFDMLHEWHADVTDFLFEKYPDWQLYYLHLHAIDLYAHWFMQKFLPGSYAENDFMREMFNRIYESMDKYIGRMMKYLDGDTTIFVVSDHGVTPRSVGFDNPGIGSLSGITNKVMEDLGYTKCYTDENGVVKIDWTKTKAVFQRSSYVYLNLKGREPYGIVEPEDQDRLIDEIIGDLYNYRDPKSGTRVVAFCMKRDEMESVGMGGKHCGDILVQLTPNFNKEHAYCPSGVVHEGYSLNNLCFFGGGEVKKGEKINRIINVVDVVPTICHLLNVRMPSNVEGGVIWQAIAGFAEEKY